MIQGLIRSDSIMDQARSLRHRVELDLHGAGIGGELLVTGPASLAGVLTKGDVDLHLRVAPSRFSLVVDRLAGIYRPASVHSWGATLAVFDLPATVPAGLAVTPIDSEHDRRFTAAWRRLRDDPDLLAEYNALKLEHFGTPAYEDRKADFFATLADA
jgi:uncharacterized protein